jgi:hypothetical protein
MFVQTIQSFIWVQTLVLALVAIIQALVSSAGLSEAFGSVRSAAEELKNPAREILEAAKLLSVRSQTIETHASELGRLAAALTNKEEDITAASQQKPRQGPIEPSFLKRLSKGGKLHSTSLPKRMKRIGRSFPMKFSRTNEWRFSLLDF